MKSPLNIYRKQLQKLYGKSIGDSYFDYADELLLGGLYDLSEAKHLLQNLVNSASLNTELLAEITILSKSDKQLYDENSSRSLHALKGRSVLRTFLLDTGLYEKYTEMEVIPLLFGSLQYGDPRNCDVDMLAVGIGKYDSSEISDHFNVNDVVIYDKLLTTVWNAQNMPLTKNVGDVYIGRSFYLEPFIHDGILNMAEESPERFSYEIVDLCIALTGIPLFQEDQQKYVPIRNKTQEVIEGNPLLSASVNMTLNEIIADRR